MGTGYVRADTGNNIATGNVINASDLDGEFDAIVAAFDESTGHTHDGTSAEGAPITKLGPTQDVDIGATAVTPKIDNTVDLGSSLLEFKDLYIDGTANIDTLSADTATIGGGTLTSVSLVTSALGTPSSGTLTNCDGLPLTTGVTGTLPVTNGGTGATSLTSNNVILGNGTSAVQFVAPGTTGNILTSDGTTWTSSAPAPGGIDYVLKTANYTTQNNEGVLADTSGGSFTVTLPATPSTGDQVVVADPTGDWGTNNLTIARNGSTIAGAAQDLVCDIAGVSVQLVYDNTTWVVYAQIGGNGGTVVTETDTQTLTNKTIDGSNNTITNISLTTGVSGTLPVANGGTGITSFGTGVGTALGQNVTGSGGIVLATTPTLAGATLSGTLSCADQILDRPVLEDYAIQGVAIGNTGATRTIDLESGNFFSATLDQACTFTFSNPAASGDFCGFALALTNGDAYTITWPASVDWVGGTAPTLTASGLDLLVFVTYDGGTTWLGLVSGTDIK